VGREPPAARPQPAHRPVEDDEGQPDHRDVQRGEQPLVKRVVLHARRADHDKSCVQRREQHQRQRAQTGQPSQRPAPLARDQQGDSQRQRPAHDQPGSLVADSEPLRRQPGDGEIVDGAHVGGQGARGRGALAGQRAGAGLVMRQPQRQWQRRNCGEDRGVAQAAAQRNAQRQQDKRQRAGDDQHGTGVALETGQARRNRDGKQRPAARRG